MSIGPRDRNYSVTLTDRYLFQQRPLAGGDWSTMTDIESQHRYARLSVNNPWRERKPDGLVPTDRLLQHWRLDSPVVDAGWKGSVEYRLQGPLAGTANRALNITPDSLWESVRNEAILDALSKLKDQKFNAGVAVAEAEGVARLVVDGANFVRRARYLLRHGDYRSAYQKFREYDPRYLTYPDWRRKYWDEVRHVESVRHNQQIPGGWLYYHYGLKPTIDDIDAACQEMILKDRTNPNYFNGKVVGFAKVVSQTTQQHTEQWITSNIEVFLRESMRVILHVQPKGFAGKLSQLGMTNPAEAVYNRIPFSFVVDYFTTVGDWLSVLDSWVGWEIGNWEECLRQVWTGTIVPSYDDSQDGTLTKLSFTPGRYSRKDVWRVVKHDPYGPFGSILPQVKLRGPSLNQIASMLSLLATGFNPTVRP